MSRSLLTVAQFAKKHPAFSQGGLRWLIFNAKPRASSIGQIDANGLDIAIVRVGRRVLIDEDLFFDWVGSDQDSEGGSYA
ncbi:MAG: hypothetical protein ABJP66_08165 [Hyphomicrobiales bacterium]